MKRLIGFLVALVISMLGLGSAQAAWPDKPLRLVIPFAPGGGNDQLGRLLAERLGPALNTTVFVENKPGAGGNLGAELVAHAPADGYTLLMASNQVVINPSLYPKLAFDVEKDLTPVAMAADVQFVLVANRNARIGSVADVIRIEKAAPKSLNHGTPGSGTPQHLAAELFNNRAGTALVHVPYKGTGPMTADLLGGQIQLSFATLPTIVPYVKAGKVVPLAVTGRQRSPLLPEIATLSESGVPGYEASTWYGLLAPARTNAAVLSQLEEAVRTVMADPGFCAKLQELGFEPRYEPGSAMRVVMANDLRKWSQLVKAANVRID